MNELKLLCKEHGCTIAALRRGDGRTALPALLLVSCCMRSQRSQVALDRLAFSSALRDDGRLYGRAGVSGGYADYVFQQAAQARTRPVTLLIANLIPKAIALDSGNRKCDAPNKLPLRICYSLLDS